jgi:hypothetical protein
MNRYTQYTGTFTKKDGTRRTMSFIKTQDLPKSVWTGDTSSTGGSTNRQVVYDTKAGGFRNFNFGTQIGQLVQEQISYSFDKRS